MFVEPALLSARRRRILRQLSGREAVLSSRSAPTLYSLEGYRCHRGLLDATYGLASHVEVTLRILVAGLSKCLTTGSEGCVPLSAFGFEVEPCHLRVSVSLVMVRDRPTNLGRSGSGL